MQAKLSTWLVVALAGGALVAGCGSSTSGSSTSGSSTSGSSTSGSSTSTSSQTAPTATQGPTGQQAVELCKRSVQAQTLISASAKVKLEKACAKVATGGQAARQEIAKEACIELVNATHLPAGPARERALSVCKAP